MEDYKEKYEKLHRFVNDLYPHMSDYCKEKIDGFPELKESEDERIRKKVIEVLKFNIDGAESQMQASRGVDRTFEVYACNKVIAWLEKKGEHKCDCKYVGCHVNNIKRWCHKKQSEILYEKCNTKCSEYLKQTEQKPTDKVEQKFKVGDWVVWNEHIICHIDNIYEENTLMYTINTNGVTWTDSVKKFDAIAHLWTIKDAKDGDVLADGYGIYIFEKFNECDKDCFVCNGAYQYSEKAYECGHMLCSTDVHPATKAERDLLFQKMEKAGYEWNAEKKELKKIEQKPDWSEEDEKILKEVIDDVQSRLECSPIEQLADIYSKEISWLKSLKERMKGE